MTCLLGLSIHAIKKDSTFDPLVMLQEHAFKAMSFIAAVVYQQIQLSEIEKPSDAAITHSLLDCVPELLASSIPVLEMQHQRLLAARLFLALMTPSGLRLAVKTAQACQEKSFLPLKLMINLRKVVQ
jgi:hypothetical protein